MHCLLRFVTATTGLASLVIIFPTIPLFSLFPTLTLCTSQTTHNLILTSAAALLVVSLQPSTAISMPSSIFQDVLDTAFSSLRHFRISTRSLPFQLPSRHRRVCLFRQDAILSTSDRIYIHAYYGWTYGYGCVFINLNTSSPFMSPPTAPSFSASNNPSFALSYSPLTALYRTISSAFSLTSAFFTPPFPNRHQSLPIFHFAPSIHHHPRPHSIKFKISTIITINT